MKEGAELNLTESSFTLMAGGIVGLKPSESLEGGGCESRPGFWIPNRSDDRLRHALHQHDCLGGRLRYLNGEFTEGTPFIGDAPDLCLTERSGEAPPPDAGEIP